jgi:hypothetical protein
MNTTTHTTDATAATSHQGDIAECHALRQEVAVLEDRIATLEYELHTVYHSRSWQITRPLRLLVYFVIAMKRWSLANIFSKKLLYITIAFLEKHPKLKFLLIGTIKKMGLRDSVVGLVQTPSISNNNTCDEFVYRPKNKQSLSHEGLVIFQKITSTFPIIPHE